MKKIIEEIAKKHLFIKTLETRGSDSLDFYDLAIWGIRQALEDAYETGYKAGETKATISATDRELFPDFIKEFNRKL